MFHGKPGHAMAVKHIYSESSERRIVLFEPNLGYVKFPNVTAFGQGLGQILERIYCKTSKRIDTRFSGYTVLEILQTATPLKEM